MKRLMNLMGVLALLIFLIPFGVKAIDGPARVKVGQPWMTAEIKSVKMVNSMCSIELMITNTSGKDYKQMYPSGEITAYDDEGNQYIRYFVVDPTGRSSEDGYRLNLPADIPVKYTLQIRDIKEEATLLRRVDWDNLFRLYDIPLVRD